MHLFRPNELERRATAALITLAAWTIAFNLGFGGPPIDGTTQDVEFVAYSDSVRPSNDANHRRADLNGPQSEVILRPSADSEYAPFEQPVGYSVAQNHLRPDSPAMLVGYQGYSNSDLQQYCDEGPRHGLIVFVDYAAFRGLPDGGWENNGINAGINFGTRLGGFSELTGIGFQIGGSAGADDWSGTDYRLFRNDQAEVQGFVTYGLFRAATDESRYSAALVQDWMINSNFGIFAQNPTLSQLRVQLGYAICESTEIGVWGAWRVLDDTRPIAGFGNVTWRPVNQLNGYVHYKWCEGGPDSWVWLGVPERDRLGGNGSLGDYLVGALTTAPLSNRLGLYALITYMHPSAAPGPAGSNEDAWDFTIGLAFYPGGNSRSKSVTGQRWMPQLPVANNGYFLVDTNRTY